MTEFRREVQWIPAFDKRSPDATKNYGINGVEVRFLLHGPNGTIQFLIMTNWQLKKVQEQHDRDQSFPRFLCHPLPADLGYHWDSPRYKDQRVMEPCNVRPANKCYYDGSGLNAERLYWEFVEKGDSVVWEEMEEMYERLDSRTEE